MLEEILQEIKEKIQQAEKIIVNPPHDEPDRVANDNEHDVSVKKLAGNVSRGMTNADLIRGMSDEELAIILPCPNKVVIAIKIVKNIHMDAVECECDRDDGPNCARCCLRWLQKELKETDTTRTLEVAAITKALAELVEERG